MKAIDKMVASLQHPCYLNPKLAHCNGNVTKLEMHIEIVILIWSYMVHMRWGIV